MEDVIEGKMEPELGELESSSAATGFEAPGQQCLSSWKIQRTIVNDCSLVDGSSNLWKLTFSLEQFVIRTQPDTQTSAWFDSSHKNAFLQISRKSGDKEGTNGENKQFVPGG